MCTSESPFPQVTPRLVGSIIPASGDLSAHDKCCQNCHPASVSEMKHLTLFLFFLSSCIFEEVQFQVLPVWPLSPVLCALF